MSATRFQALSYLGYRALLAHPLKRLRQRGSGLERFVQNYESEGLYPTSTEDLDIGEAASACISCGLCETGCDLAAAAPSVRDLGLHATFRLYSKSTTEMHHAAVALAACASCEGCDPLCPTGVPITRIVRYFLTKIANPTSTSTMTPTANTTAAPNGNASPTPLAIPTPTP
jgi:heterodisulfide reductase subunit C